MLFSTGKLVAVIGALVSTAEVTGMVALNPTNRQDKITHIRIVSMMGMSPVGYRPHSSGIGSGLITLRYIPPWEKLTERMGVGNSLFEIIIKLELVFRDGDGREGHSCSTCPEAQDIMSQLRLELSPTDSCPGAVRLWAAAGLVPITATGALLQKLSSFLANSCLLLGVECAARPGRHDSPIEWDQSVVLGGPTAAR